MQQPESPETVFSLMYSRLPDAKRVVVYDNACKVLEYCLNREPTFFKDAVFLLDRLHAKTHVGCTSGKWLSYIYISLDVTCVSILLLLWTLFLDRYRARYLQLLVGRVNQFAG